MCGAPGSGGHEGIGATPFARGKAGGANILASWCPGGSWFVALPSCPLDEDSLLMRVPEGVPDLVMGRVVPSVE